MEDQGERRPPTRAETLTALTAYHWGMFSGTVLGFEARDDGFLVVVRHPRTEGEIRVAYLWPDAELTGDLTGEPQETLESWVIEIAADLDEYFGTEPSWRLQGAAEAHTGYRVVRRYGPGA